MNRFTALKEREIQDLNSKISRMKLEVEALKEEKALVAMELEALKEEKDLVTVELETIKEERNLVQKQLASKLNGLANIKHNKQQIDDDTQQSSVSSANVSCQTGYKAFICSSLSESSQSVSFVLHFIIKVIKQITNL